MIKGEFPDGTRTLRAKIEIASPISICGIRSCTAFCTRPIRTPAISGAYIPCTIGRMAMRWIEGITHSICTLEFENHRPLYDWFVDTLRQLGAVRKARPTVASPSRTVRSRSSSRLESDLHGAEQAKLLELVKGGHVSGWDDPPMPDDRRHPRRGYTPEAVRPLPGKSA